MRFPSGMQDSRFWDVMRTLNFQTFVAARVQYTRIQCES